MYLYYLLSFKMNEAKEEVNVFESNDKIVKESMLKFTANTFILALDGDVEFKPEAVTRLLDLMKKGPLVGAACGRIHPIGTGKFFNMKCYKSLIEVIKLLNFIGEILLQVLWYGIRNSSTQ